ncbi:protein LTV1-like protein [Camelus ferus]|nr:protein LTV1-like protein [Camelus ferus]
MIRDEERRAEQRKYGVFFDDDYDYLQHLKEPSGPSELVPTSTFSAPSRRDEEEETLVISLPSSVFASEFEEDVGLLNKAAPVSGPRLDFDPDIVAALDDDFDFDNPDNLLEDDFILQASKPTEEEEGMEIQKSEAEDDSEWEDVDDDKEGGSDDDNHDPAGSSEEDMSAHGKPLGAAASHLFWEEETKSRFTEYSMTSSVMRRNEQLTLHDERFEKFYEQYDDDEIGALDNAELEGSIQVDSSRLEEVLNDYYKEKAEKYGLTAKQVERMQMINNSDLPKVSTQPHSKNESKEDKRARKQAIREERKERRVEKKANKLAFKLETRRQEKELLNLKKNVVGLKL